MVQVEVHTVSPAGPGPVMENWLWFGFYVLLIAVAIYVIVEGGKRLFSKR